MLPSTNKYQQRWREISLFFHLKYIHWTQSTDSLLSQNQNALDFNINRKKRMLLLSKNSKFFSGFTSCNR